MSAAITFDTYELVRKLKQSGFNEEQAEGISTALKKTHEVQLEGLASKHDLNEFELKMDNKLSDISSDLEKLELKMEGEFRLIKWGLALVIAVTVLPVLKQLFD